MSASALSTRPAAWAPGAAPLALSFRLKAVFRLAAVTLAALQAWRGYSINPDGVSYIDIADAYLRGDWSAAVNTYWSPLYSWLLAGGLGLVRPSPMWEFAVVKVVNGGVFLAALAAFEWFLHEALAPRPAQDRENAESVALPRWLVAAFAYSLFLWSSFVLTSVALATPDLLVSVFVFLLTAWVLRARRVAPGVAGSLLFGLMLGAGCLAKAALLPLGLLFLIASLFAVGSVRKAAVHGAAAAAVLVLVFGSFVGAMYAKSGRVTLGDVSRLNYIWLVNGVPDHGWDGGDPRLGTAAHPPRRLASEPPVFDFSGPAPGTCPLWYDPPRWCEGLTWTFDLGRQASVLWRSSQAYVVLFCVTLAPLTGTAVLLHLGGWLVSTGTFHAKLASRLRALAADYPLLLPGLGACALYALVVVEARYLTGFLVLLGVAALRAVRYTPARQAAARRWGGLLAAAAVLAPALLLTVHQAGRAVESAAGRGPRPDWQIADAMRRLGVRPGDHLGVVSSCPIDCGWARQGRFRVTAEVRPRDVRAFWAADAARLDEVLDAFRDARVVAVVACGAPESAAGWERISGTDLAVRILPSVEQPLPDAPVVTAVARSCRSRAW